MTIEELNRLYVAHITCSNCGEYSSYHIPKGTPRQVFKCKQVCPDCGCKMGVSDAAKS